MSIRSHQYPSFLYSPERIGTLLEGVGSDLVNLEQKEIQTLWFRSAQTETDIFIWYDKKNSVIKQQVTNMGTIVEWNIVEGIRTGIVLETEILPVVEAHPAHPDPEVATSDVIHYDSSVQQQSLQNAIDIVFHAACIEESMKSKIIQNFRQELKTSENLKIFNFLKNLIRKHK